MSLITEKPDNLPSGNDLDNLQIPDDLLDVPAAYFSLGSTPAPLANPPEVGDKGTLIVRYECTGEGKTVRTDGELRYSRKLTILWAVPEGTPQPPDPEGEQPALFDTEGNPIDDEPAAIGDLLDTVVQPPPAYEPSGLDEFDPEFSHSNTDGSDE
jgi:hypothetical protein